jgi:hypothetical protein
MKELNNRTKTIRNFFEEMPKLEKRLLLGTLLPPLKSNLSIIFQ